MDSYQRARLGSQVASTLDKIKGVLDNECACGCGREVKPTGASEHFATEVCQQRWMAHVNSQETKPARRRVRLFRDTLSYPGTLDLGHCIKCGNVMVPVQPNRNKCVFCVNNFGPKLIPSTYRDNNLYYTHLSLTHYRSFGSEMARIRRLISDEELVNAYDMKALYLGAWLDLRRDMYQFLRTERYGPQA